jgi:spore coat polysaccharide biosynthesis protein SpsF
MTVRVVIQARLSSTRLPGKALLAIAGMPMIVLVARRVSRDGTDVLLATSTEPEDDLVARAAGEHGVPVVRGSLDDTLARFVQATWDLADEDIVIRLTADNLLPDAGLVGELVAAMRERDASYIRLGGPGAAVPYGIAAEAFTAGVLRRAAAEATDLPDREHVTPYIRRTAGDVEFTPADVPEHWQAQRCTVDTLADFEQVWRLFDGEPDPVSVSWRELCGRLDKTGRSRLPVRRPNPIDQGPCLLGAVQLGLPYGAANMYGLPSAREAHQILTAAAAAGVSHVDTARAYGDSERRIGAALARGLGERLGVVTKVRPLDDVPFDAPYGWAQSALEASLSTSLRELKSGSVDALLLHRAADLTKGGGAVRDGLRSARDAGLAQLTGVSVGNPGELVSVLADPEVGYVQLPFNLLDARWTAPDVTAALAARPDVVVSVRSVFLQGLLVGGDSARWPALDGQPEEYSARIRRTVDELVADLGRVNPADLCVAYVLGHPWVVSVTLGADTADQVREHADLVRHQPLTADEIDRVRARIGDVPEQLVDPSRW